MEVSDFARAVLFGATLEEKLTGFDRLTDERPGESIQVPTTPTRPPSLAIVDVPRAPFPATSTFERDEMRGLALHFFANHELLAAELMALCLLRFPDAPAKFRLTLAQTIADEQKHLGLYRARMETLGIGLGEVPMNDFFWRAMKDASSPVSFVAGMSLTFEQANLDFSKQYEDLFRAVGDEETAALMHEVYEDEIRHVRFGVRWFQKWRAPETSLWDALEERLVRPLSPIRAKGSIFDVDGRRRAGFPEAYVERLRLHRATKGRAPKVWIFNATAEEEMLHGGRYTAPAGAAQTERDLAFVMAYLAKPEDVVIAPPISDAFRHSLIDAGFEPPRVVSSVDRLGEVSEVAPWGESPRVDRVRKDLGLDEVASPDWFDKAKFAEWLGTTVCRTIDEVERAADGPSLIKGVYGASGRHQRRVDGALDANTEGFVRTLLDRGGAVLVEPLHDRVRDFGAVIDVGRTKPLLDVYEMIVDARGVYRGHRHGPPNRGLDAPAKIDFFKRFRLAAETAAHELKQLGFAGPAGFDGYGYRVGDEHHLRVGSDLNARLTMGHVARALFAHVVRGRPAQWRHVNVKDAGGSLETYIRALVDAHPVEMKGGRIARGAVATTDPALAVQIATVLLVDV